MDTPSNKPENSVAYFIKKPEYLWHMRLGHLNRKVLKDMASGLDGDMRTEENCTIFTQGKHSCCSCIT